MITVIGMWEPSFSEYEQIIEYRMWKQTIAAFDVDRWCMAGEGPPRITSFESFKNIGQAICDCKGPYVFMMPDTPMQLGLQTGDVTFIFGNADENLESWVTPDDIRARLPTPKPVDMFAAACLPWALSKCL